MTTYHATEPEVKTWLGVPATVFYIKKTKHARTEAFIQLWHAKAVGQKVEHEAGTIVVQVTTGDLRKGGTMHHRSTHQDMDEAVATAKAVLANL